MSYLKYEGKNIYYKACGEGRPLIIIHGDTASSKMLMPEVKFYAKSFKVIALDLLGQGKSQRVEEMPLNCWEYNADLLIGLCENLGLSKVNLIGTSGGAIVALNAVLKRPDIFDRIVADSFIGESLSHEFAKRIAEDREKAKASLFSRFFWFLMHGFDWRYVIDQNTRLLIDFSKGNGDFFGRGLDGIENSVLIMGSARDDMESVLRAVDAKIRNSKLVIFDDGNHPAMLSNKKEFRNSVMKFLD